MDRPVKIAISNTSGTSGIAHWINTFYNFRGTDAVDKKDKLVEIVKEWVDDQYNQGRVTMITDGEIEEIVKKTAVELKEEKYLRRDCQ